MMLRFPAIKSGGVWRGAGGEATGVRLTTSQPICRARRKGSPSHQLLLRALGADDVVSISDEAPADQGSLAGGADEAVVVPVAVLEGDEAGPTNAGDGLDAGRAPLGEQLAEAVSAVRLLVAGGEALSRQRGVAVGAGEALPVPGLVLVGYTAGGDNLVALDAAGSKLLLVAGGAVDLLLARDEALGADCGLANDAAEALLMPLPGLVLHLLRAGTEDLAAAIAAGGELGVVAVAAVDVVRLGAELLVHQGHSTLGAQEARFVPVLVLVRQILGVDADGLAALLTVVGEDGLVALDAVGVVITEHVALPSQRLVALPAAEVAGVPVLVHGLGVLATLVVVVVAQLRDGHFALDTLAAVIAFAALAACLLHATGLLLRRRVLHLHVHIRHCDNH